MKRESGSGRMNVSVASTLDIQYTSSLIYLAATTSGYGFTEAGLAWLKEKGYEFVKVNANPGDLILWDSR